MAMLSRVAEAIYWIGRYVERAENTARLIDVSLRSSRELVPARTAGVSSPDDLSVVVVATGNGEEYARRYGAVTEDGLATFMVTDRENPNSVISSLFMARHNARGVREAITSEMWEELNRAYLTFQRVTSAYLLIDGLHDFCRQLRLSTQLFQGVTEATMPRDEGYHFLQAGKYLERSSMTARILDARVREMDLRSGRPGPEEVHRWLALLRSVSGYEAYAHLVPGGVQPAAVAEFLLFNLAFPRSVAFGIHRVATEMEDIEQAIGASSPQVPSVTARALDVRLRHGTLSEFGSGGLHSLLRLVERQCNVIGDEIRSAYFENAGAGMGAA